MENKNNTDKLEDAVNKNQKINKRIWKARLIIVAVVLFVLAAAISLYVYFETLNRDARELALIEDAQRRFAEALANKSEAPPTPEPQTAAPWPSYIPEISAPPELSPKAIRDEYLQIMEEYDNYDIVGHLKISGTTIDYLVVQASDNAFYLERGIDKKYSSAGWIFLDYENDISLEDPNTIIYGHNMKAQVMFHDLRYYIDEEYFKQHKYIYFNTLYEDQTWEIFSFYITDTSFRYIDVYFDSYDQFFELAKEMKSRSMYDTGVELVEGDRVLSLSTCTGYSGPETRFVVSARLIKAVTPNTAENIEESGGVD